MLRPMAVQAALTALLGTPSVPADCALIVFSDSGTVYAQAHSTHDSHTALPLRPKNDSQRQQLARQPGLHSLMGSPHSPALDTTASSPPAATSSAMPLAMDCDERAKVFAAVACQSWTEERNRVRRLFSKVPGHGAASISDSGMIRSFSGSTGGGGNGNGVGKGLSRLRRVEQDSIYRADTTLDAAEQKQQFEERQGTENEVEQESVGAPFAVPGTMLSIEGSGQGVAPLLLEGELGALLVMPLHHQLSTATPASPVTLPNSPPLLLVLSARLPSDTAPARTVAGEGASMLSPEQWNDLHDAARAFAVHVGPALRKAFGREDGVPGEREVLGDGATVSDMESSVSLDGGVPGTRDSMGLGGISVR